MDRAILGLAAETRATGEAPAGALGIARAPSRRPVELDLLASDAWPGVPPTAVLLPPDKCRSLWRQFFSESARSVQQAVAVQARTSLCPPDKLIGADCLGTAMSSADCWSLQSGLA